jgi:hypothetical protein
MFAALGPEYGERAYRALVRVLHPDGGGDHQLMVDLNKARDRVARGQGGRTG